MTDLTLGAREVPLGGLRGLTVHRTLPQRGFPTVGAWCFVDHFGPSSDPMIVLPHPHTGLQTVTWPLAGEIRHRDSLGSEVVLRPGELNLMTSGDGVSHSEFSVGDPDVPMHGLQLWVALPADARRGPAEFEHHPDLPVVTGEGWSATILLGEVAGAVSPATTYTPIVGAEMRVRPGFVQVPLREGFEHAILAVDGPVTVDGEDIAHREMRYLGPGRTEVGLQVRDETTLLLIGGEPFDEELVMWWNFVGRSHEDIADARADWEAGSARFGHVDGHGTQVIPAPPLPDVRLSPRRRSVT
ncbi:pirin family protein [Aeromicrobium chenweiae]|uniref:Pirin n=1 Tax=Aeromicrobium chenweiae TaxID=2079793 RepID=A0A2S0WJI4_9ACTN|nr:pirin family protein [Aeromicrobium chenweiae]AWB91493.1 pirin [Aeromicrobium chenweiae]TGN29976.1 pirin family protein [Aeromicrobium chenweiae]